METSLPEKNTVQYILCEDVRKEAEGKLSLLGVFLANRIFVTVAESSEHSPGPVALLSSLAVVATFRGGVGKFKTKFEIFSPGSEVVVQGTLGEVDLDRGDTSTAIFKINGFQVPEFGTFLARFTIGTEVYDFNFSIERKPKTASETG